MKRLILLIVRIVVATAGIAYILYAITWHDYTVDGEPRAGMLTILGEAKAGWLAGGLALMALAPPGQALRWWLLLRCRRVAVGYGRTLRLTMLGLFFNFCVPGMTGGDVVKAYYVARGTERRGAAIMSIVFDRVCGLVALVLLAGMVGLGLLDHEAARRVTLAAWAVTCGAGLLTIVYFSPRVRRAVGLHRLLAERDPGSLIRRVDAAAVAYHHHLPALAWAVLLSLGLHTVQITATAMAGYALGMTTPLTLMLVVLPVVLAAGAMPLTYQGLGVMEAAAYALLVREGEASVNQVFAMLMLLRVYLVCYGLLGSLVLLRGDLRSSAVRS